MSYKLIKEEKEVKLKYDFIDQYKNKIPLDVAIIESGFPPENWLKIFKPSAVITKAVYEVAIKKIARTRKKNYKLSAN